MANNLWNSNNIGVVPVANNSIHIGGNNGSVEFGDKPEIIFQIGDGKCDCCKKDISKQVLTLKVNEMCQRSLCFFCIFENIDKSFKTGKSVEMERALYEEDK